MRWCSHCSTGSLVDWYEDGQANLTARIDRFSTPWCKVSCGSNLYALRHDRGFRNDNASLRAGIVVIVAQVSGLRLLHVHDHLREGDLYAFGIEGQLHLFVEVEPDAPVIGSLDPGTHYDIDR